MHQKNAPNIISQEESIALEMMIFKYGLGEVIKELIYICIENDINMTKEMGKILG